jgi:hypothetical protein
MGRRKGNNLEQRKQRLQERLGARAHAAQAAKAAQVEAEAKAKALHKLEAEKAEARKNRLVQEFVHSEGMSYRSQKTWGGEMKGDNNLYPFVWVRYYSFPNGSSYYRAESLVEGLTIRNVYGEGVDLGVHFFDRDLIEVHVYAG